MGGRKLAALIVKLAVGETRRQREGRDFGPSEAQRNQWEFVGQEGFALDPSNTLALPPTTVDNIVVTLNAVVLIHPPCPL